MEQIHIFTVAVVIWLQHMVVHMVVQAGQVTHQGVICVTLVLGVLEQYASSGPELHARSHQQTLATFK